MEMELTEIGYEIVKPVLFRHRDKRSLIFSARPNIVQAADSHY
jgi:hypothetical protein